MLGVMVPYAHFYDSQGATRKERICGQIVHTLDLLSSTISKRWRGGHESRLVEHGDFNWIWFVCLGSFAVSHLFGPKVRDWRGLGRKTPNSQKT